MKSRHLLTILDSPRYDLPTTVPWIDRKSLFLEFLGLVKVCFATIGHLQNYDMVPQNHDSFDPDIARFCKSAHKYFMSHIYM